MRAGEASEEMWPRYPGHHKTQAPLRGRAASTPQREGLRWNVFLFQCFREHFSRVLGGREARACLKEEAETTHGPGKPSTPHRAPRCGWSDRLESSTAVTIYNCLLKTKNNDLKSEQPLAWCGSPQGSTAPAARTRSGCASWGSTGLREPEADAGGSPNPHGWATSGKKDFKTF